MTPDPRDTARTWLAEQIARYAALYWIPANGLFPGREEEMAARLGEFAAKEILSPSGVEVDQFGVLDGPTLNLKGKRITVTLPLMPLDEGDIPWLFTPPTEPIEETERHG